MSDKKETLRERVETLEGETDPSVQANTTAVMIQKTLRFLIIATVLLYLGLCGVIYYTYTTAKNSQEALCAYRIDLQARIDNGAQVIANNPKGLPGIPLAALKTTLASQKRAEKSLSAVNCSNI